MNIDTLAMLFPNVAVTRGIAVRVAVSYLSEQSDPSSNRWLSGPELAYARIISTATSLPDGTVLVAGGRQGHGHDYDNGSMLNSAEIVSGK